MSLTSIQEHNQEAKAIWDAFHAGQPIRPPVQLGTATQFFIFNDDLNPGEATRHFKTLRDEINAREFETGFPVDFGKLRQELGPDVLIHGGPNIMLLLNGRPEAVREKTWRILNSGIMQGERFVLREGNNLAPRTPFANLDAMYQEARQFKWQI